jgi:DNA-binding MarR family transcriptional regulator
VKQSNHPTIRTSNDLVGRVAQEIALGQHATGGVDEAAAAVLGVNPTDLRCLGQLFLGPSTAGALAEACGLTRGAMTTALDRLEAAGYVRRVRSTTDRRQVVVDLTEHALERCGAIWGPIATAGMARLAEYDEKQLEFLLGFLREGRELQEREAERIRAMGPAVAPS